MFRISPIKSLSNIPTLQSKFEEVIEIVQAITFARVRMTTTFRDYLNFEFSYETEDQKQWYTSSLSIDLGHGFDFSEYFISEEDDGEYRVSDKIRIQQNWASFGSLDIELTAKISEMFLKVAQLGIQLREVLAGEYKILIFTAEDRKENEIKRVQKQIDQARTKFRINLQEAAEIPVKHLRVGKQAISGLTTETETVEFDLRDKRYSQTGNVITRIA